MSKLETLQRIGAEIGFEPDRSTIARLDALRSLLMDYNAHTNLTAIRDPLEVEIKLLADSLALLPLIEVEMLREAREAMRVIDIGTGAGFPGLPLAIANPALQLTLVDATRKKVAFIEHVAERLNLSNVIPIHSRSEDLAHEPGYREQFDIVTARAVASLPALIELCLPFVRVGGLGLLTKGRQIQNEISSAGKALSVIGGDLFDVWEPQAMELEYTSIVQVRKFKPTPKQYPRSAGTPANNPILG
ncbi:MAG: 16S rRNA (guanine(527)-N(7))-methyltransferase RsmG [Thermomicrobiaceae bacterium]